MPTQTMHPALSQLLPLNLIPNEFEDVHEALENVYSGQN